MIELERDGGLALLTIRNETKRHNPFSMEMTRRLTELCAELEADEAVDGVFLWGGEDRSFSVGGDFREVRQLTTEEAVRRYALEIIRSYQALLAVTKPLVVGIDHYAIGYGLQVALMGDWLVGSQRSSYHMPELKGGLACPMGSAILEHLLGRSAMLKMVMGCEGVPADEAHRMGLIQELVPHEELRAAALQRLHAFTQYPRTPLRLTKRLQNERTSRMLEGILEDASRVHWACFAEGHGQTHFAKVLGSPR